MENLTKKLNFLIYQQKAIKTAIYPSVGQGELQYPELGTLSELGEVASLIKKLIRDGVSNFSSFKNDIISELGDVLWYLAIYDWEVKNSIEDFNKFQVSPEQKTLILNKLKEIQEIDFIESFKDNFDSGINIYYPYSKEDVFSLKDTNCKIQIGNYLHQTYFGLFEHCTNLILLDFLSFFNIKEAEKYKQSLSFALHYVAFIARYLDSSIYEVAQKNIEKLESRKNRNVLGGSGDNR